MICRAELGQRLPALGASREAAGGVRAATVGYRQMIIIIDVLSKVQV